MNRLICLVLIGLFIACSDPHPGYRKINNDCYLKLISMGASDLSIQPSDWIALQYSFCEDENCDRDSLDKIYLTDGTFTGLCQGLENLGLGDEFQLLLKGPIPGLSTDTGSYTAYLKVVAMMREREFSGDAEVYDALAAFREEQLIQAFIHRDSMLIYEHLGSCYVAVQDSGRGDTVVAGREISLRYKGYLTNGKQFDNTDQWQDTLSIVYGKPGQLIPGLEQVIFGLRSGAEAKIIIPSHLAFGTSGSVSGIVPPYEPVIYQLNIKSVNKPQ